MPHITPLRDLMSADMSVAGAGIGEFVSDPLTRAMADLAEKERVMKVLQNEIGQLRSFIAMYRDYSIAADSKRSKKDILTEAAADAIREAGSPMPLSMLSEAIKRRGIDIGTSNPKQYLSTTLNRDDRFVSIEGKGWSLKR